MNPRPTPAQSHWMLVDDDADFLRVLAAAVQASTGAEIETHDSPTAALAAFVASPGKYELVITDYEMPEMDGEELCRRMRSLVPAQRIVLATGSGCFTEPGARRAGFSALLDKPFPLAALHRVLAQTAVTEASPCAA